MVTVSTTLIICATVTFIAYRLPNSFTFHLNKTITVTPTPTPQAQSQDVKIIPGDNQHLELATAINQIMTEFNGGSDGQE